MISKRAQPVNKVALTGGQRKIAERKLAQHLNLSQFGSRGQDVRQEKRRQEKERGGSSEWPSKGENNKMKAVPLFRLLSACWEGGRRERENAIKQI